MHWMGADFNAETELGVAAAEWRGRSIRSRFA
jgi:hypothetical protein